MNDMILNHKQIASLIRAVGHERTVLVRGEAGIGKTSIHYELRDAAAFKGHHFVSPIDCTQLSDGSIWMPDIDREAGVSRELPNERLGVSKLTRAGGEEERPVLLCFDEIGKARQYIKDTIAPIVYERRIGDYRLPAGSVVFACTNLDAENLGDQMQAHLRNRLMVVTMRKPTAEEWITDFAIPNGLHEAVIAGANEFPRVFDSFLQYQGKNVAKENPYIFDPSNPTPGAWVTPRSLHAASDLIKRQAELDEYTLHAALAGTVGAPFAQELISLIRFGNDLPDFARIVADPGGAPVPTNPTAQILLAFKLVTRTDSRETAGAVIEYVKRLRAEQQSLFITNVANQSKQVAFFITHAEFARMMQDNRRLYTAASGV